MKRLITSLGLALLTSTSAVAAVDPGAASASPAAAAQIEAAVPAAATSARPSEERIALARRYIALVSPAETSLDEFRELTLQMAGLPGIGSEDESDRADAARFIERVMIKAAPTIRAHMLSINEVRALTYAREFSPAELEEMIAFAQTPGGKHYFARHQIVDLDPAIMAQTMLLNEAMEPVASDVRKEMCQEATAQRIAAGDKKAKCPLANAKETQDG